MAVKLSSWYWFRNNHLVRSLEDVHSARHWFGGELLPEDKKALNFIVEEVDQLKDDSYFRGGKPLINPIAHVLIPVISELKDVTSDPELAAAYFEGIHGIMEGYWVKTEMYRQLGNCFDEVEIQPRSDTAEAISYAHQIMRAKRYGSLRSMCWKNVKDYARPRT